MLLVHIGDEFFLNCFRTLLTFCIFKADRFVDRKLDQVESLLNKKQKSVKKWYSNFIGDANGPKLNELHIFVISFAAGIALGLGTAA